MSNDDPGFGFAWSPNPTDVPIPHNDPFDGDWPKEPLTITHVDRDNTRQLVVASYNENLTWLKQVKCDIIVYTKANPCPHGVPCVQLANRQREAGTILYHIVNNWSLLAPLTIFCQGNPFDHSPDFLQRITLPYAEPTSLTTRYLANTPEQWIKDQDTVEYHHGHEVRYGNALIQAHTGVPAWFDTSVWDYVFDCPMPDPLLFGYAATWAVPREMIKRRPRAFYAWLLSVCDSGESGESHTIPPVNPWTCEGLWKYIWSDPAIYPHKVKWTEPELPSLFQMAINASKAVVAHILDGLEDASTEVQADRWLICEGCDHYRPSDKRCGGKGGCGCWLEEKIKYASSECPLTPPKW